LKTAQSRRIMVALYYKRKFFFWREIHIDERGVEKHYRYVLRKPKYK
jgi:hypothetical protein